MTPQFIQDEHAKRGILVVIGGPTASGKTNVAATLGKHFGTEVISADSRQFYRAMRIGTARPSEDELLGVRHHFLGHLELHDGWSAGAFARAAEPVLQDIVARTGLAVLVGGSGLYIDALIKGLDPLPTTDIRLREKLMTRARDHGREPLLAELKKLDPITWERIDRNNTHRIIRALEICMITGRPGSAQRTTPTDRTDLHIVRICLELPRKELYERIDSRVDRMIRSGLMEEARALIPYRDHNALRTVGYRELFDHFDERISLLEAIASIKQHTRNYAKRQITWWRRDTSWRSVPPNDPESIKEMVQLQLKK